MDAQKEDLLLTKIATIEANQQNMARQLGEVVKLLDRMVRVEEHQSTMRHECDVLWAEIDKIKENSKELAREVNSWSTARKLLTWLVSIMITVGVGTFAWVKHD